MKAIVEDVVEWMIDIFVKRLSARRASMVQWRAYSCCSRLETGVNVGDRKYIVDRGQFVIVAGIKEGQADEDNHTHLMKQVSRVAGAVPSLACVIVCDALKSVETVHVRWWR